MKTFLLVSVLTLARFSYAANGPAKLWLQLTEKSAKNFRDAKVREDKATLGEQKYVLKQFKASLHEWKENQAGRTGSMELKVICSLREPGDEVCEMTLDFYDANQTVLGTSGFLFEGKQRDAVLRPSELGESYRATSPKAAKLLAAPAKKIAPLASSTTRKPSLSKF